MIATPIVPDSENYHSLAGLKDQNGNAVLPADVLIKVSATDATGTQVLAPLTLPEVSGPASDGTYTWAVISPATTWVAGNGPWVVHIIVTDPTGATIYHDFAQSGYQAD